jgi:hypothetical protein
LDGIVNSNSFSCNFIFIKLYPDSKKKPNLRKISSFSNLKNEISQFFFIIEKNYISLLIMKKSGFFFLSIIIANLSFSQYQVEAGARQGALGGSGLILKDIWSAYHNQAALADISALTIGIFYSSIFNEPDLREIGLATLIPIEKFGNAGINYTYAGNEFSNFGKFGLNYSKRLGKNITAGIQIDYFNHLQANYGNTYAVAGEIGLVSEPIENLFIAAHVFNPWRSKFKGTDEYLSSIIRLGAGYYFTDKVVLMVETEKDLNEKALVRVACEYELIDNLLLRGGVTSNPVKYSFGLGYIYKGIMMDAAYINHQILGYYMQFGLGYTINGTSRANNESNKE